MTLCVAMFSFGQRRLGDEGPEPSVVGGVGEVAKLLVGDDEFFTQLLEPFADLGEPPFQQRPRHGGDSTCPDRAVAPPTSTDIAVPRGLGTD